MAKQTAQEKAQAALEISDRKIKKLEARRVKAQATFEQAAADLAAEKGNNAYIRQHPALQPLPKAEQAEEGAPAPQPGFEF